MNRQHEVVRVPLGWAGQDKQMVIQINRILDDIYNKLNDHPVSFPLSVGMGGTGASDAEDARDNLGLTVANNLTTEDEGSVLDARQGKTLKDLIDGIPTEWEEVTNPVDWDATAVTVASCDAILYKCGKLRFLRVSAYIKTAISGTTTLGTLASGHIPAVGVFGVASQYATSSAQHQAYMIVGNTGNISMTYAQASSGNATRYRATFVYFVE